MHTIIQFSNLVQTKFAEIFGRAEQVLSAQGLEHSVIEKSNSLAVEKTILFYHK